MSLHCIDLHKNLVACIASTSAVTRSPYHRLRRLYHHHHQVSSHYLRSRSDRVQSDFSIRYTIISLASESVLACYLHQRSEKEASFSKLILVLRSALVLDGFPSFNRLDQSNVPSSSFQDRNIIEMDSQSRSIKMMVCICIVLFGYCCIGIVITVSRR